jgi:dolichol-phosphate mannosyltransferase
MIKFYGTLKEMPVLNLRHYSIYGPFEEPEQAHTAAHRERNEGQLSPLVQPDISRDFVVYSTMRYMPLYFLPIATS